MTPSPHAALKGECAPGYHEWETAGIWGVVLGASKCIHCGRIARLVDFPAVLELVEGETGDDR